MAFAMSFLFFKNDSRFSFSKGSQLLSFIFIVAVLTFLYYHRIFRHLYLSRHLVLSLLVTITFVIVTFSSFSSS